MENCQCHGQTEQCIIVTTHNVKCNLRVDGMPDKAFGLIKGIVKNEKTCEKLAGARCSLILCDGTIIDSTYSDKYGKFLMSNVPMLPNVNLIVTYVGFYPSENVPICLRNKEIQQLNILLRPIEPIDNDHIIIGTVMENCTPLDSVQIVLQKANEHHWLGCRYTDHNGFFQFDSLEPDNYKLNISKNGYLSKCFSVHIWPCETINDLNIRLYASEVTPMPQISGYISHLSDAVTYKKVLLLRLKGKRYKPYAMTYTNQNGFYLFDHVNEGCYLVKAIF